MSKDNNKLTIAKCMEQVDMTDYYITKNILKIISNKKPRHKCWGFYNIITLS